jgi:CheY-like chemotaxis protein
MTAVQVSGGGSRVTEKAKILLVDDRQENLLALEAILSSLDQILVRANSGEEALKALLVDEFAVILLDVQMPGLDGFETAGHIKRREKTKDVPIIFLTAISNEPHHAYRGYAAGAVDYIAKPFDPWVLRAKVSVFVDLHRKNRLIREQSVLLRRQMLAAGGAAMPGAGRVEPSGNDVLDELNRRLVAVEEQVEVIAGQARLTVDTAMAGTVSQLEGRVARLRAALDPIAVEL